MTEMEEGIQEEHILGLQVAVEFHTIFIADT